MEQRKSKFTRSLENRRVINAYRRKRLGSVPTKFVQTDDEVHQENIRAEVRERTCTGFFASRLFGGGGTNKKITLASLGRRISHLYLKPKKPKNFQHENIYRGLLRSLLHPLGAPDNTVGLRPGDLLDHLREVFEVDQEDHELYIVEELPNRPQNMQVNIAVLEANGLRGTDFSEDTCDCYCLLCMHHPTKGKNSAHNSPKGNSPKLSPKGSNRTSPSSTPPGSPQIPQKNLLPQATAQVYGSRGNLSQDTDIQKTSTVKNSSHPKWNEEYTLDVEDYLSDEVHVYICDQDTQLDSRQHEKHHGGIKNFLGVLRHSGDQEHRAALGYIGKVTIPVRNIAALGTDDWYDVIAEGSVKGKPRAIGKCHLKVGISYKEDQEESCYFSSEDYYQAYKQFLHYTYKNSRANPARSCGDIYGSLSLKDHRILQMFAEAHRISKLSQAIVNVICLLEMQCEESILDLAENNLHAALDNLRMTWATMQIGQRNVIDRMPLTDIEISNYRKIATKYIHQKSDVVSELPELFPPTLDNLNIIKSKLGVVVQLLSLDLWESSSSLQKEISETMTRKLQDDMTDWITSKVREVDETKAEIKDKILPEVERLINLIDTVCCHTTELPVLKQFYHSLAINYYKLVSFAMEKKISAVCLDKMEQLNRYMKKYNNYAVNIMMASKQSLRMYFSLRKLQSTIRDNVSRRDVFKLGLYHYQEWFEESMVYWLQTFRSECIQRMEKALEIDKDVVVVTDLVKYSHSSVDVLSCFAQVIEEWRKIDFRDADCCLIGVTNITDIICDGARLYADKIHFILERNCYYDDKLNSEFDVNDRLCITLNNIEHVRKYLSGLPSLLDWDNLVLLISTRYDDSVGNQTLATLQRLTDTANEEILMKSASLLRQICEKMRGDMERYMAIFTRKEPKKSSSSDQFLGYLNTNLQTLNSQLMPDIYPYVGEQLWNLVLTLLHQQLLSGGQPDYYEKIKVHLQAIVSFFLRTGLEEKKLYCKKYDDFKEKLELNSQKTEELMLQYYHKLAVDMASPMEYYGDLAFKAAYVEETRGNVTVYVNVLRGNDLPGLDSSGYSDPYVEVSLQPAHLFGFLRAQRTQVVKQTLNPMFNVTFQFPNVPRESFKRKGTCILMSVFDHDHIGRDDFAGEVVCHLPTIHSLGMDRTLDRIPALILPLKRPKRPFDGPYDILSDRDRDKSAKKFIADRQRFIDHQPTRTDKQKADGHTGFFSNLFNFS